MQASKKKGLGFSGLRLRVDSTNIVELGGVEGELGFMFPELPKPPNEGIYLKSYSGIPNMI